MFCDIHNHVLPGVDDGSVSLDESLRMIDQALDSNISLICATPHVTAYSSEVAIQEHHFKVGESLREELYKRSIPLEIQVGCELYFTSEFPEVAKDVTFRYNKTSSYCLVELPPTEAPPWFADMCFSIMMSGVKVVLAHPERNMALMRTPSMLARYVQTGILTQVTAGSIIGNYGSEIQEFAQRIVKSNACSIIACDAHDTVRRTFSDMKPAYNEVSSSVGMVIANNLCIDNPRSILRGDEIQTTSFSDMDEQLLLKPKKKKKFLFF